MKFVPKIAGKVQRYTYETVKDHILHKLQKDLEHGKDIATNLRSDADTGIDMKEPIREEAEKKEMTEKERESAVIREEFAEEQQIKQRGLDIECTVKLEK